MDAPATYRRIKCLACVCDFTKECLTITTAFGISGAQNTRILESIALFRDYPENQDKDGRVIIAQYNDKYIMKNVRVME